MQEMKRMIKYVLDTKDLALKIKPTLDIKDAWSMVSISDSDYATNPERRISISGYVLYLKGVLIWWRSKGQKSVTLSSTEAEYIAMSECAKEINFVHQLLTSMGIKLDLPIVVRVDNIGVISVGENISISQRTTRSGPN
jgi:membrane-bound inhibitor of C-type lysozyme